jgi:phosphatidylserine/phosphatidylglycerophosphate/cardiolipin synthase-like enzyme
VFEAIGAARDHINLETYIFEDDEVGRPSAAALIDKQARGVQVNVLYDSVGSIKTPRSSSTACDRPASGCWSSTGQPPEMRRGQALTHR